MLHLLYLSLIVVAKRNLMVRHILGSYIVKILIKPLDLFLLDCGFFCFICGIKFVMS